jgi:hypothetical protein
LSKYINNFQHNTSNLILLGIGTIVSRDGERGEGVSNIHFTHTRCAQQLPLQTLANIGSNNGGALQIEQTVVSDNRLSSKSPSFLLYNHHALVDQVN